MPSRDIIADVSLWQAFLGLFLVGFSLFVYRGTSPPIPRRRRMILGALRSCLFLLLLLFILDPAIVETSKERVGPAVLALVDSSRSMSIEDCDGSSRIECALGAAGRLGSALRERWGAELIVIPFSKELGAERGTEVPLRADGEGTDIAGAVEKAGRRYRHLNLAGIVLLSDGRVTSGMLAPEVAVPAPIFAIGVGDTVGPPDVKIDDLVFERVAYAGTRTEIEAVIDVSGCEGRGVTVRLLEGTEELARARIDRTEGRGKRSVKLGFRPDRPGEKRLTVEALPVEGEEWTGNNSETAGIRVLKERIRILHIDRFADWNTAFLRDLARRAERFEVTVVVWMPGEGYVELPGREGGGFSGAAGSFDRYDLVIVSDDGGLLADPSTANAVVRYVVGGGALLLLADEHSPLVRPGGIDRLEGVSPVVRGGQAGIETGEYEVSVPKGAEHHPLAISFGGARRPPPLPGRAGGLELSSAATAPLVMIDRRGSHPFLAVQRSGDGIAAAVLGFPLWRWKLAERGGAGAYAAFIGGLIQYLAEGGRTPPIVLESARSAYRTGERIVLNLYAREETEFERMKGEIRAKRKGDGIIATHLFERAGEGRARATIAPLPPGEYEAVVSTLSDGGEVREAGTEFSVLSVSAEFMEVTRDMDLLRRLARASGGRAVELSELGVIVEMLDPEHIVRERTRSIELRESFLLLVAILFVLTAEWVLRKLWGLV